MLQTLRKTTLSALLFLGSAAVCLAANAKPFVVPELTEWQGAEGCMTPSGNVVVASSALKAVAEQFCRDYQLLTGRTLKIADRKKPWKGDIVMRLRKEKALGEEGYRMTVGQWCEVSGQTAKAVYWVHRHSCNCRNSRWHCPVALPLMCRSTASVALCSTWAGNTSR